MKLNLQLILLFMLCGLSGMAQVTFDKGYFVDNDGKTTYCLIKNMDWDNSPSSIQYKSDETSDTKTANIQTIKEFGIDNYSRYLRASVKIDKSSYDLNNLSTYRQPKWSEETVFLKEIVCGKATLYVFTKGGHDWFFYSQNNSQPTQLVYKQYLDKGYTKTNLTYLQQLLNYVQNEYTKKIKIERVEYNEKDLVHYFKTYNQTADYCDQTDFKKPPREQFNIKAQATLVNHSISFDNTVSSDATYDFGTKLNWKGGLEFEYFYPAQRNRYSILFNPTYKNLSISTKNRSISLQNVDLPIGIRYYKYLNSDSKLYANVFASFFNINMGNKFETNSYTYDLKEVYHFTLGAGYAYKNIDFEFKYDLPHSISHDYIYLGSSYSAYSLSISYKFYKLVK